MCDVCIIIHRIKNVVLISHLSSLISDCVIDEHFSSLAYYADASLNFCVAFYHLQYYYEPGIICYSYLDFAW